MKKYTVYKTTNLINNKIYIGVHRTSNVKDAYLGSGTIIKKAIDKYGKKNFKKEILFVFDNYSEMIDKEREIVNSFFIKRKDTYNLSIGGCSNPGNSKSEETKSKMSKSQKGKVTAKDKNGNTIKISIYDERYLSGELIHISTGIKRSEESKKKLSESLKGRKLTKEHKRNISESNIGISRNNGYVCSFETKEKLSELKKGHTHNRNRKWVFDKTINKNKFIKETELEDFLINNPNYKLGRK